MPFFLVLNQSFNFSSRDYDLANQCTQYCADTRSGCLVQCNGNATCAFGCDYGAVNCAHSCPCFEECPTGCDGCVTPFCSCHDYLTNPDYIACERQAEVSYNRCLVECPTGDFLCIGACNREYQKTLEDCPCRENCPNGCPCENYDCNDLRVGKEQKNSDLYVFVLGP